MHIKHGCSRSRGEDVTITDVIIKTPDRKCDWGCEWRHARKRWTEDFGWFFKKAVSWDLKLDEACWFLDLGEASRVMDYGMPARRWVRWNSKHCRNCVCLSLSLSLSLSPRVENLNLKKVIKVSSVFRIFRDSYAYERTTYLHMVV